MATKVGRVEGVTATLVSTVSGHKGRAKWMFNGFLLTIVNWRGGGRLLNRGNKTFVFLRNEGPVNLRDLGRSGLWAVRMLVCIKHPFLYVLCLVRSKRSKPRKIMRNAKKKVSLSSTVIHSDVYTLKVPLQPTPRGHIPWANCAPLVEWFTVS